MKITKSAFPIQHPDRAMILPCLQSLEGKEGKETSWSILAVKLLGTECAKQAGLITLSIRGGHLHGLQPTAASFSSRTVHLAEKLGKTEVFFKTE